ncbi:MAG: selenocysteine-specific translation elongation factor [Polyangiaceae bacterium]
MRRFVLGTAGHVDHGKTTLVRALTGIDTDRLPEEKRRGITIELGFAQWKLAEDLQASIIDVPGHKRLVHTMIAGAVGMELVLLVVAADEGVMPQTREHLAACEILGIRRVVVALTKIDRVERELAELAAEEIAELLKGRFEVDVVPCSAKTGEGLERLRDVVRGALLSLAKHDHAAERAAAPAHLSVDRAFSVRGAGTVVTGTLVRGALAVGDAVHLVGDAGSSSSAVRGLHVHDHAVERAEAPTRLAVNLAGLSLEAVSRGDVLTTDAALTTRTRFDARVHMLSRVRATAALEVYVGTARSSGRLTMFAAPEGEEESQLFGRVRLGKALALRGDRFVLRLAWPRRARTAPSSVAASCSTCARACDARQTSCDEQASWRSLPERAAGDRAGAHHRAGASRPPQDRARGAVRSTRRRSRAEARRQGRDRAREGGAGSIATLTSLAKSARELVHTYHAEHVDAGMPLETLRQRLRRAGVSVAQAIKLAALETIEGEPIVLGRGRRAARGLHRGRRAREGRRPARSLAACARRRRPQGLGEFALGEVGKVRRRSYARCSRSSFAMASSSRPVSNGSTPRLSARLRAKVREHLDPRCSPSRSSKT